jgi:hypothetical protein
MNIFDNIRARHYQPSRPRPGYPSPHPLLARPAGQLSDDDLARVPALRDEQKRRAADHEKADQAWVAERKTAYAAFKADLFTHFNVDANDPFVQQMWATTDEVISFDDDLLEGAKHFEMLMPLYRLYKGAEAYA